MIIDELFEAPQLCPECGGISFSDLILAEKKDACYHKVKASAKVWPSAYASGRLVQCRKKGAANYGNKSESVAETRRGQVPMTLKPGETDDLEPEDFEGFRRLPEYLEGRKAQQKAGKDLIQQSPYTFQSDQDWAYRQGAFDTQQAAVSADFAKLGPLTTAEGLSEEESEEESERRRFPNYYQHKDRGTVFKVQSPDGKTKTVPPGDEKWDDYYQKKFKGMPTPNDGGFWSDDDTAAMVEETEDMAEGWRDIYNLNKQKIGTNPNLIKPDTVLKMPDGSRYKVKSGDNLSSIAKISGAKSAQPSTSTSPKVAAEPKYYTLPPGAAAAVKPAPEKPARAQDDNPVIFDLKSGQSRVKPDRIADVFQNPKLPPPLTRDEIEQQMMQPDFGGPNAPGYKHIVTGQDGEEHEFDSGEEAKDFVNKIEQLRLLDLERGGLGTTKSESINDTVKEVSLGDYRKKAALSKATSQMDRFFGRDNPEKVARADQTIAKRERGLARADARVKPYTPPPVDKEKQRQELTDKYPNIDELVRRAEVNRDHDYEYADGQAYYAGQEAEQKYQRLKKIQRIIQGLDESKTLSDYMDEAKNMGPRNPYDLQPLEGPMGGGGGGSTGGPSPFKGWFGGAKPGSREASISQNNPNTMTVKQGPNPDYVPPKTLQQKYDELNKKLDQLPPAPPVKTPRPGRAASDQRQKDQAQAPELKDVVPLSPAERDRLRPVDADKVRRSELNKEPPDLSNVRPGRDYKEPSNWDDVRPGLDEQSVAPATNASTLRSAQGQAAGTAPQGLTPQQQTAFAPHLKTDSDTGSQYYDTPDTDPKEVGAMMGTKITTPAAQALVKSPQGQAGVIKHLTAVTDPKNTVNPSTTTVTPMSPADAAAAVPDSQPASEGMHRLRELSGLADKGIEEQSRKKQPPEEKYGPEYDDMVARVKKLAGLGPMKTVWDPAKRQYRNMPTAQQPKK